MDPMMTSATQQTQRWRVCRSKVGLVSIFIQIIPQWQSPTRLETNLWHKKLVVWVELQLFRLEMVPPLDEMPANQPFPLLNEIVDEDIRELTLQRRGQLDPRLPHPRRAKASLIKR